MSSWAGSRTQAALRVPARQETGPPECLCEWTTPPTPRAEALAPHSTCVGIWRYWRRGQGEFPVDEGSPPSLHPSRASSYL
jgi:hypothetical protein